MLSNWFWVCWPWLRREDLTSELLGEASVITNGGIPSADGTKVCISAAVVAFMLEMTVGQIPQKRWFFLFTAYCLIYWCLNASILLHFLIFSPLLHCESAPIQFLLIIGILIIITSPELSCKLQSNLLFWLNETVYHPFFLVFSISFFWMTLI